MGNHGYAQKNGAFHNHEKYLDHGPVSLSIPQGDIATVRGTYLYRVKSGHQVSVGFLTEAVGGIWNIAAF